MQAIKFTPVIHQFSLFDYNQMRPKMKVPMKALEVKNAKAALLNGDPKKCAAILRDINARLEHFESRL